MIQWFTSQCVWNASEEVEKNKQAEKSFSEIIRMSAQEGLKIAPALITSLITTTIFSQLCPQALNNGCLKTQLATYDASHSNSFPLGVRKNK